eukprot:CAMPEP_0117018494 /NCGR_PEP_ID=MMETSP0472-20121206/14299_1 /TAXON_ID=693140 ORGANISM="Tiarina fusus, Strain LIS" /NCGR_SAMPLE_ID=MMETSP0472 /ASSEMBLY_ACC=CAM_ASM_000603 /LENGTH=192 /DNA_ID=CAMNT_0004723169 /DNA_START=1 /DNA_END=579 /DNA_ORIENTATION=-
MTISFRKDNCVSSPLSETSNRHRRKGEEEDVLTWVDKYASSQRNMDSRRRMDMISTKREARKVKTHDSRKAGSARSQNVQVYVEPVVVDSNENPDRQTKSRNVDRDPVSSTKLQTQLKTTKNRPDRVLSSVSSQTEAQNENRTPFSMNGGSKISTRIVKVREMGGRRGMQDKLRKMRSPPGKTRALRSIAVN